MQYLQLLKLILSLFPLLTSIVDDIEKALPVGGQGAAKLELAKGVLGSVFSAASDVTVKFEDAWPAIANVIGAVVAFKNKTVDVPKAA